MRWLKIDEKEMRWDEKVAKYKVEKAFFSLFKQRLEEEEEEEEATAAAKKLLPRESINWERKRERKRERNEKERTR